MCSEKGYSTAALTEIALRKITFKGTLTVRDSWINHEAAWEECLQQTSMSGEIERKRFVTIHRESRPDPFFQTAMLQKRFDSWQAQHSFIADNQIQNPQFLCPWHEDVLKRQHDHKHDKSAAHDKHNSQEPKPQGQAAQPNKSGDKTFKPLEYRAGKYKNVNPNFKLDLNMNPNKQPCERCQDTEHRYPGSMCTSAKTKDGKAITPLPHADFQARLEARWNAGFFATKPPKQAISSLSVSEAAAAAATVSTHMKGGARGDGQ